MTDPDTLQLLADAAAGFLQPDAARVRALRTRADRLDRSRWCAMADLGWFGTLVPEVVGGLGLGLGLGLDAAAVLATRHGYGGGTEPLVPAGLVLPACLAACVGDGSGAGVAPGNHAAVVGQAATRLLPDVLSGQCVLALAWQNPQGALGLDATAVHAQADGADHFRLDGSARFVLPASADVFIVWARQPNGAGALFAVPRGTSGLQYTVETHADDSQSAHLHFSGVRLSRVEHLFATDLIARNAVDTAVSRILLLISAELVGLMDRVLEMTLDYLRTRKQFGKPIGSFQVLQHRAVDMWIQRELARAVVDAQVALFDAGADAAAQSQGASSAKARAAHAATFLCNQAIQLHGAIGFTDEYALGQYVNRALTLSAWLGNAAEHRQRLSQTWIGPQGANA